MRRCLQAGYPERRLQWNAFGMPSLNIPSQVPSKQNKQTSIRLQFERVTRRGFFREIPVSIIDYRFEISVGSESTDETAGLILMVHMMRQAQWSIQERKGMGTMECSH